MSGSMIWFHEYGGTDGTEDLRLLCLFPYEKSVWSPEKQLIFFFASFFFGLCRLFTIRRCPKTYIHYMKAWAITVFGEKAHKTVKPE